MMPLLLAPFSWVTFMILTSVSIAFLGNPFLKPNYALTPEVSTWSINFVEWWALYKAQEVSSRVLIVHLRGTVFLNYWFEMLGAKVGSSVLLDTVDITGPLLVSIGDGAVIAEGALLQGHRVNNGVLRFHPIRISANATVGPYAVIQKGSIVGKDANIPALQNVEDGQLVLRSTRTSNPQKVSYPSTHSLFLMTQT